MQRNGLRGALCLCLCKHVGELSKHIARLFQWFPTVIRSLILILILWKRKKPPRNCPSLINHGVRKRHTSPLKSSGNWRWDPKEPDGLGLRTCSLLLSSSCWDQMNLSLIRGSFFNKILSLGYRYGYRQMRTPWWSRKEKNKERGTKRTLWK